MIVPTLGMQLAICLHSLYMTPGGGVKTGSLMVNGIKIAYRRWAAGRDGFPPAVLLHGALQTSEGMRHLAEKLAIDGEVVAPDLRGRGASERPPDGYDPGTMADDVAQLLDALHLRRAMVVGRQHGGVVAYHLAAKRPELVCGLVLGDSSPEISAERAARIQARIASIPSEFPSRAAADVFYETELKLSAARAQHDIPSDLEETADGRLRWRHNLEIIKRIDAAAMPRSDWMLLAQVHCPTLILRGQRGEIGDEIAERMQQTIAQARCHTILGAGRDVFLGPGAEQTMAAIHLFRRELVGN